MGGPGSVPVHHMLSGRRRQEPFHAVCAVPSAALTNLMHCPWFLNDGRKDFQPSSLQACAERGTTTFSSVRWSQALMPLFAALRAAMDGYRPASVDPKTTKPH